VKRKKPARCDVALLVDEETGEYGRGGRFIPEDDDVEEKVLRALRRRYRRVEVVPFSPKVVETIERLRKLRPRMVMNLTEWVDGDRKLDAAIAGLLEVLKLPYTGAGPAGLRLARDKALSKQIVSALGVAVPRYFVLGREDRIENNGLSFPLMVKPQFGDGSDGIGRHSLVRNVRQLRARVRAIRRNQKAPALCEEFVSGNDLYVGLIGNEPRVLPPVELCADNAVMIAASGAMRYFADPANPAWRDFLSLDALPSRQRCDRGFRSFCYERLDGGYSEHDRVANHLVHPVALEDGGGERQVHVRLGRRLNRRQQLDPHLAARSPLNPCEPFASSPVEHRNRVAGSKPKHACQMLRFVARERNGFVARVERRCEKPVHETRL